MTNLLWLLVSVSVYSFIFWLVSKSKDFSFQKRVTHTFVITLLCIPFNLNGDIYTVFGSAKNEEGGVYSIFSLYQESNLDTVSILGSIYQKADGNAFIMLGISGYQEAGDDAIVVIGISGYQKAGNNAVLGVGVAGYQKAENKAGVFIGASGYQNAGNHTGALLGIYQTVEEKTKWFGIFSKLKADETISEEKQE